MAEDGGYRGKALFSLQLAALLLFSAGALQAQQQEGSISGEIRLIGGGFPNGRLEVHLESHGSVVNVTYCDEEGLFSFTDLLPNTYSVVIQAQGYQPVSQTVAVNPELVQSTFVHVILRPIAAANVRASPNDFIEENEDVVSATQLSKKYPPEVRKEFEAGKKAEAKDDTTAAIEHYQAALKLAPDFYQAHNNLGGLYIKKGEFIPAEKELRRALELNSKSAEAEFNLGNVLYLTGRDAEAKNILQDGLSHSPASAMGRYFLGCVLIHLKEFDPAEDQLKSAQQLDPRMPQVPIALATLYLQTGRRSDALHTFEEFLRQFPNDPLAPKVRDAVKKLSQDPLSGTPPS